jgi:hypothetical protein
MVQWEYRVIHINVEDRETPPVPDPEVASQKLHGVLSPAFIAREFPEQYRPEPPPGTPPRHPAQQLQDLLNQLGTEGWEMVEASQVGGMVMFVFKRPLPPPAPAPGAERATRQPARATPDAAAAIADATAGPGTRSSGDN